MECRGHRNLNGVQMYKCLCEEQHKEPSDVLHGGEKKKMKTEEKENSSQVLNVLPGNKMSARDTVPSKPVLNFSGCNGIIINYNF